MRMVLRIAARHGHSDMCMGAFGVGPGFRNPVRQVAAMWRDLLFGEEEFKNAFNNIVFAIENTMTGISKGAFSDHEIFKREFDPSIVVPSPRKFPYDSRMVTAWEFQARTLSQATAFSYHAMCYTQPKWGCAPSVRTGVTERKIADPYVVRLASPTGRLISSRKGQGVSLKLHILYVRHGVSAVRAHLSRR